MDNNLNENLVNSSDESDCSNYSNKTHYSINKTNKKKKTKTKIYIELNYGFMKSKTQNLKNRHISQYVNIYNAKNDHYFSPEKFRVSYDGFRYLPNSNIYQDNNN
jgi:hypothetical protein